MDDKDQHSPPPAPKQKSRRTKICFYIRSLTLGGSETQLYELVRGLSERDFEILVLTYYPGGEIWDRINALPKVELRSLNKRGRWDLFGFVGRSVLAVYRFKPDYLYSLLATSNLYAILIKLFRPQTRVLWGIRGLPTQLRPFSEVDYHLFRLERLLWRFTTAVIVNSKRTKQALLENGFWGPHIEVIPNGVRTDTYKFSEPGRVHLRKQWNVSESDRLVGMVARIDPMKNHPLFIETARLLLSTHPSLKFVCVGGGNADYAKALKKQTEEYGLSNFIWAGEQTNLPAVYSALDVLCLPSLTEGFPNVVLEAMACERTCVVTNVSDLSDVVSRTGQVVPEGALASELASALVSQLELLGPKPELGKQARAEIQARFDTERLVLDMEKLIETLELRPLQAQLAESF